MRPSGSSGHHVLLIPFAPGIGDVVMTEPLLRAVRERHPHWRLTVAVRPHAVDLLPPGDYRLVTPFYFVSEAPSALKPLHHILPQTLLARAAEPAISLNFGPFDRVINLFWAWESRVPFDRWWTPAWPLQQGVSHGLDVLAAYLEDKLDLEIPVSDRVPRLEVSRAAVNWVERYLMEKDVQGSPLVAMVVSADSRLKWWDAPKWAELHEWLRGMGWRTVMVAPRENRHAQDVYNHCRRKPLWPALELRQVAALLARSDLVVGIDTGPLHMAGALGTRWVGLFGPSNPHVIGPYDCSKGRAVVARLPKPATCKDCWLSFKGWGGRCRTLRSTGCTTLITVVEVSEAILSVCCGTPLASSGHFDRQTEED